MPRSQRSTPRSQDRRCQVSRPQRTEEDNARLLAASVGLDAESALHASTEKAYAEALQSLANMREILARFAPITPATAAHLAEVRRFARLVSDVEGLL